MTNNKTTKKGILFYPEWLELIDHFTNDEKGRFYDALFRVEEGAVFDNRNLQSVFNFIIKTVLENNIKYKNTCETNAKNAKEAWEKRRGATAYEPMPTHAIAPKAKRFVKPTMEELLAFQKEINKTIDCQGFLDYYDSNGWKVGKNPMKDWKATMRRWGKSKTKPASNFDSLVKELSSEF